MSDLATIREKNTELQEKFQKQLQFNPKFDRKLVSFQGNKNLPEYRWFKYKEGFSAQLIHYLLKDTGISSGKILDPFAGSGTTLFVSHQVGLDAIGIEVLPVACEIIKVRESLRKESPEVVQSVIRHWQKMQPWQDELNPKPFPHLRITRGAFPKETETELGQYLAATEREPSAVIQRLLRFAALCTLEEISYTRKDGQYLRWDYRSGRGQGKNNFTKKVIKPFKTAIYQKLEEILLDIENEKNKTLTLFPNQQPNGEIRIHQGSCFYILPIVQSESLDGIVTSPPYCNRYDYTRTYALELAMLGIDEEKIRQLRQDLVSCTVENREKADLQSGFSEAYSSALNAFTSQEALQTILKYLEKEKEAKKLNNPGIVRMVRNYFLEMSLFIFECARILKPGAPLVIVNDNVRYQGAHIPVDLILSDIAQKAGFEVETIWMLPTGKGNSSQQMGKHGREELRKCIYVWRRSKERLANWQAHQLAVEL